MKNCRCISILFVLLILIMSLAEQWNYPMAASVKLTPEVQLALGWLKGQFNPYTVLPQSYENPADAAAWTYDMATWIIVMTQAEEMGLAAEVVNTMLELQSDGAWADGYNIITGSPITKRKSVGSNAWMGLALCHYSLATKRNEALKGAIEVADWLLRLREAVDEQSLSYGAIPGGLGETGNPIQWISVEHNTDALAFLYAIGRITEEERYDNAARLTANWMVTRMWNQPDSHFEVGTTDLAGTINRDFPEHLDTQTWTILAIDATQPLTGLKAKDYNGLPWIHQYEATPQYNGKTIKGFGVKTFGRGCESFWSEGTAGYGLAAMTLEDYAAAGFYLSQILLLQTENGGIPYSVSSPGVAREYPQNWDFNSIAATTWMIWLASGINPFAAIPTTQVLIVEGTIYEADGETVVSERLPVTVQNVNSRINETVYTSSYAEKGQYIATLVSTENPAASFGDILEVEVSGSDGRPLAQEQRCLTLTEVQSNYVQLDLIVLPTWDMNKDGIVDILDLIIVGRDFGATIFGPTFPNPDVNGDGIADMSDLILIGQHFGEVYSVRSALTR